MKKLRKLSFGVVFVALIAMVSFWISSFESIKSLNISPLVVGIVIGMVLEIVWF